MRALRGFRFAVAGPSGSGKSTIAKQLARHFIGSVCVEEPPPPDSIAATDAPSPAAALAFQRNIALRRASQAIAARAAPVIFFDRTFEEDREIFLPLYSQLHFLSDTRVEELRVLSHEHERTVGTPDAGIILFAKEEVLRHRVISDEHHRRPQWLMKHLDTEFALYNRWITTTGSRYLLQDTTSRSISEVTFAAIEHLNDVIACREDAC